MLFRDSVGNGRDNEPDDVLNAKRGLPASAGTARGGTG